MLLEVISGKSMKYSWKMEGLDCLVFMYIITLLGAVPKLPFVGLPSP